MNAASIAPAPVNASFDPEDILDPVALATQLHEGTHPCVPSLLPRFSTAGREALAKALGPDPDVKHVKKVLAKELSRIVTTPERLFTAELFVATKLRRSTKRLLKQEVGLAGEQLRRLHVLLIQDAFPEMLDHDSCELIQTKVVKGTAFRIYCERRKLKTKWGISFRTTYQNNDGEASAYAESLKDALAMLPELADLAHSGKAPEKPDAKPMQKEQDDSAPQQELTAKADAYDKIADLCAQIGFASLTAVHEFVADAVRAQTLLGRARPLLEFIIYANELLVKPVKPCPLQEAGAHYSKFVLARKDVDRTTSRSVSSDIVRFVEEMQTMIPQRLTTTPPQSVLVEHLVTNDIQAWINSQAVSWKRRRDLLDKIRAFLVYCRDSLHALPDRPTAAHGMQRPKPDSNYEPVPATVLAFLNVWRLLLNVQDLEALFFVALGTFAGLHQTEILRLVWEHDIKWKDGRPCQVFIASGKGKDKHGHRLGVWVDILAPLDSILSLGKGKTGRIVTRDGVRSDILVPLINRLQIEWDESIMRHTFISNLFGIGNSYEAVARQARNSVTVLKRHYYAPIEEQLASLMFSLPVGVHVFSDLPDRKRAWDWGTPLRELSATDGGYVTVSVDAPPYLRPGSARPGATSNPRKRKKWPTAAELQVRLWEKPMSRIAEDLGCSNTALHHRVRKLKLLRPQHDHWDRLRWDMPVVIPLEVIAARAMLAQEVTEGVDQGATLETGSPVLSTGTEGLAVGPVPLPKGATEEGAVSAPTPNGAEPPPKKQAASPAKATSPPANPPQQTKPKRGRACTIAWPAREELYRLLWEKPATHIAQQLGCSHGAVLRRARALSIPTPGNGYWQRKNKGFPVVVPPAVQVHLAGLGDTAQPSSLVLAPEREGGVAA